MRERFSALSDESVVFRLATPSFVPDGAKLPLPNWLRPTDADAKAGKERGRPAGLSAWDNALTTLRQAKAFHPKGADSIAFSIGCGVLRAIGAKFERKIDVVADPWDEKKMPGWEGHSLIEGLERPGGFQKQRQMDLQVTIVDACASVEDVT